VVKLLDRKILKEKQRELKENVRGKPYFRTLKPKFRFLIEILKLVFTDITSHRPFRSKKKAGPQLEIN
jgi:hypothetical protein